MYLVAVMDWYSRKILSWRISNTLEPDFCVDDLQEALIRSYVMATFVVAVSDEQDRINFFAVESYDGEGFVAWRAL